MRKLLVWARLLPESEFFFGSDIDVSYDPNDGSVYCWGDSIYGNGFGDGTGCGEYGDDTGDGGLYP